MKTLALLVFSVFLFLSSIFYTPNTVHAQGVNDFNFTTFDVSINLTNNDPQGSLKITEYMEVNFSGQNRGILRAIPNIYKGNELDLTIHQVERDGNSEPYTTYQENDNTIVRIGNPSVYLTSEHSYKITYEVNNVITFYDEYDELYWDINGDQWSQAFKNVSLRLITDATIQNDKIACYTGTFGVTKSDCEVSETENGVESSTTRALQPSETLTVVIGFNKDYFQPMPFWEQQRALLVAIPFILVCIFFLLLAFNRWRKEGKDIPGRGVTAPYFGRPKNISLLQAAYVERQSFDTKDITATIIDLAIRGNIRIIEKSKKSHSVELLAKDYTDLTQDEIKLLEILFPQQRTGDTLSLSNSQKDLYSNISTLKKTIDDLAKQNDYFHISPSEAISKQTMPIILTSLLAVLSIVAPLGKSKIYIIPTAVLTLMLIILLAVLMKKRTQKGVDLKEHLEGLKLYLNKAEKDRIHMQDAVAAPLARVTDTSKPEWTREFFEKLLPFAVVFGVDKTWARAFEGVYQQPPDWYQGNWNNFRTASLVSGINRASAHTASSFSAPSSSSGSGFSSGGGFSGGGGGGGGGGGW